MKLLFLGDPFTLAAWLKSHRLDNGLQLLAWAALYYPPDMNAFPLTSLAGDDDALLIAANGTRLAINNDLLTLNAPPRLPSTETEPWLIAYDDEDNGDGARSPDRSPSCWPFSTRMLLSPAFPAFPSSYGAGLPPANQYN